MKNIIRFLGFAIVLLTLVQLVSMFMPYFDFSDMVKPTESKPNPETEFSLQEYIWIDTADSRSMGGTVDMGKQFFRKLIDDYRINDHAEPLALTFLIGCVVVFLNMLNFANSFNKLVTFRASFIKVITHIISCVWGAIAVYTYLNVAVLTVPQADSQIYMIGLYSIFAATGFIVLRLIVDIAVASVTAKKERLARRAAREAA